MYMSLENTKKNIIDKPEIIYPNYKYCVWLLPENSFWYHINRAVTPHMTIKKNLMLSDAINLHSSIQNEMNHTTVNVTVDDNFLITNDDEFTSLEYKLYYSENNVKSKPEWWPDTASMPVLYKYKDGVNESEKEYMNKYVTKNNARFGTPCIILCKGHHREWKFIKI